MARPSLVEVRQWQGVRLQTTLDRRYVFQFHSSNRPHILMLLLLLLVPLILVRGDGLSAAFPSQAVAGASSPGAVPAGPAASDLIGADGTPGHVFGVGPYAVTMGRLNGGPLAIFKNVWYRDMLTRIASWGVIVVAPQMYPLVGLVPHKREIFMATQVIAWLSDNLATWLAKGPCLKRKTQVVPDWSKFAMGGHSRGGMVAFGVLRNLVATVAVPIKAVLLVDPVDGGNSTAFSYPTLVHDPNSLHFSAPVLSLGATLSGVCAPTDVNHDVFYSDTGSTAYHFVVDGYGHLDFYDNRIGLFTPISKIVCKRGPARQPMRVVTAGIAVAFFQSALEGDPTNLNDLLANPQHSPVPLSLVQSK